MTSTATIVGVNNLLHNRAVRPVSGETLADSLARLMEISHDQAQALLYRLRPSEWHLLKTVSEGIEDPNIERDALMMLARAINAASRPR